MEETKETYGFGYVFSNEEIEKIINYLAQRPWMEVNDLMGILLNKINNKTN